jgi:hypothetical protein
MEVLAMVLALEREPRQTRRWGRIVARAWDDDAFHRRLLAEPACVLREEGIDVPRDVAIRVIEGVSAEVSEEEACFWLPPNPVNEDFVEDDLGLAPDVFKAGGTTRRTRTHRASGLVLPPRPAAGDHVEDDLGLAPEVFKAGGICRRTRP